MADVTTPVTPPAQDLQINLEDAPKAVEIVTPENKPAELDLSLDLNLPEVPKNDDRLKTEDQKNTEVVVEQPMPEVVVETPTVVEPKVEPKLEEAFAPTQEVTVEDTIPVLEPISELIDETPVAKIEEVNKEPITETISEPSKVVEDEIIPTTAPAELKEDMKIIDELEWHGSAGGLAPEAVVNTQPAPVETPKTFDLDAMLGGPATPPVIEATQPVQQANIEMPMPNMTAAPIETPPFVIPTTTTQVPVQAVMQTAIPQNKNKSVKALLFVVLFAALWFTTFFILKTMYPVEFGNIFSGGKTNMHASEATTGTELTGTELSGTELTEIAEEITGEIIDTGTTIDNGFWELNDLWTTTTEPEQTDLSRLTDYVTQGNKFLEDGKTMSNNTVIKYGLYISKKSTAFLEKIANGEEINNLSGYFAQFDQYILQLQELVGQTTSTQETVSPTTPGNDLQQMINATTSPENTWTTSE